MTHDSFDAGRIVSDVIRGYEELRNDYLPDKAEVIKAAETLRGLLFPGYFSDYGGCAVNMEYYVSGLLMETAGILHKQICRALNLNGNAADCRDKFGQARHLCDTFLAKLPDIRQILMTDARAAFDGDPAARNKHEIIYAYPGIAAVSIHRLAHELHGLGIPLIPRIMSEYAHSLTGIDIHPAAKIGEYFFIDHGTGVVIGETAVIGSNVKIYQGVTLGALSTRGGQDLHGVKRHPTLEDEVTVYSGATILGGETVIGKGSVIGGNVFLTESVPANSKVSVDFGTLKVK